jgi:hypothetical protein
MNPRKPLNDQRHDLERDVEKKPDAESQGATLPHSDRFKRPIEERERESDAREHGELTEE